VVGLEPNHQQIQAFVERSLMLVTALTPRIGYEKASAIAQHAHEQGLTLKEAALKLGHISASDFDQLVDPIKMAIPHE
jgi:fumarate hydratase class II